MTTPPALPIMAILAAVRAGESISFTVLGTSMWPAVRAGARVRIEPCRAVDLGVGELAAYEDARGGITVHRVRGITAFEGEAKLRLRGDALDQDDPPVAEHQILGRALLERNPPLRARIPRIWHIIRLARWVRSAIANMGTNHR